MKSLILILVLVAYLSVFGSALYELLPLLGGAL